VQRDASATVGREAFTTGCKAAANSRAVLVLVAQPVLLRWVGVLLWQTSAWKQGARHGQGT